VITNLVEGARNEETSPFPLKNTHPFIMGAWKEGPLAALVVCPAFGGQKSVTKATVERIDLPVAHKMQRL
jgi:hypothetical protein